MTLPARLATPWAVQSRTIATVPAAQQLAGCLGHVIGVGELPDAVGQCELEGLVFADLFELLDLFEQRLRRVIGLGDIAALGKDARHVPVVAEDRLAQQVDVAVFQPAVGPALQRDQ